MSPRVLETRRCPHCKAELSEPTPRVCPTCGGSIQKRFLSAGCLTSAPPPVILVCVLAFGGNGDAVEPAPTDAAKPVAGPAPAPDAVLPIALPREPL